MPDASPKSKQVSVKPLFDHQTGSIVNVPVAKEVKAKDTNDWRLLPIPVIQMISTVWVNWKNQGSLGSIATHNIGGNDFEMSMTLRSDGPHVVCSKRYSSVLRLSHQLRITKLGSEIEKLEATIVQARIPIAQHNDAVRSIEALKQTESDPKHVADMEGLMQGWGQFEAELNAKITSSESELESKKVELESLLGVDLREVKEWSFAVAELE